MKLVLQRVSRATVEVDGFIESRIGSGIVLSLAFSAGDTRDKAVKLASRVVKLKLWPEMFDAEKPWKSSVVDNGFEILVLVQQTLAAGFPQLSPQQQGGLSEPEAKALFEVFVAQLRKDYQEEMVVSGPFDTKNMRVEATQDGPGMFELDSDAGARPTLNQAALKEKLTPTAELLPQVGAVTAALQKLVAASPGPSLAALEASRIFKVFATKAFRTALADAAQGEADIFAESLDAAAGFFTEKQQGQITAWTGLTITAPPAEEMDEAEQESLKKTMVKEELNDGAQAKKRPDWTGRAAPNTPGGGGRVQARYGFDNAYRGGVGKGGGFKGAGKSLTGRWGPARSYGIASLDEANRIHGSNDAGIEYGQLRAFPDAKTKVGSVKEELPGEAKRKAPAGGGPLKRPKGSPTVAPICPAQGDDAEEVWEDL